MKDKTLRYGNLTLFFAEGRLHSAYSYDTCVFARTPEGKGVLNRTKYSPTTSKQITVRVMPLIQRERFLFVKDVPINATQKDVINALTTAGEE